MSGMREVGCSWCASHPVFACAARSSCGRRSRMRIEPDQRGDDVLVAFALAEKLSIPPEDLRRRMRLGLVTSRVEAGEGEHAGLRRLTMRCGATVWRAVVGADDQIVQEELAGEPARGAGSCVKPYGPPEASARAQFHCARVPARPHHR